MIANNLPEMFRAKGQGQLARGSVQYESIDQGNQPNPWVSVPMLLIIGATWFVAAWFIGGMFQWEVTDTALAALYVTGAAAVWPIAHGIYVLSMYGYVPFTVRLAHPIVASLALGYALALPLAFLADLLLPKTATHSPQGVTAIVAFIVIVGFGGYLFVMRLAGRQVWRGLRNRVTPIEVEGAQQSTSNDARTKTEKEPFTLWLGNSTGILSSTYKHGAGISSDQNVALSVADAATNIMIYGGIGSGKTTRLISPLLLQVLSQDTGALIFDVKTDFIRETMYLAQQADRHVDVIGHGGLPFNLLQGISPETAAKFLHSAFLVANGGRSGDSGFWIDGAVEYCRNALGILQFFPEKYTLPGLNKFIFDRDECSNLLEALEDRRASGTLTEADYLQIKACQYYLESIWEPKEEKEKGYIRSTAAQVLSPFTNPALVNAFCRVQDGQARLEDMLDGRVFLVEIPELHFGPTGARIAYLFIKLRFMEVMKARRMMRGWNQDRPVVFLCDEYQDVVDPVSDLTFWDKSRASKTIGIVSMQGFSSMLAKLGDEKVCKAIAQNFRQVIAFRTEDDETIKRMQHLMGEVDIKRVSRTVGSSENKQPAQTTTSESNSATESWQRQHVINPQLFRVLAPHQAVAALNVNGSAADDVLNFGQIFVPDDFVYEPEGEAQA